MKDKFYFFANWKMYLDFDEANILANALAGQAKKIPANVRMAIFPNALSLYSAGQVLKDVGIGVGAQNVFWEDKGGYTGEISAPMFKAAGCDYALVGHSERRHQFHETNHEVRQKMQAVLECGLTPVLCVGETKQERHANKTDEVVETQIRAAFHELSWPAGRELIVAYEPVWAISRGVGETNAGEYCDESEAEKMHCFIKDILRGLLRDQKPAVLFGGSVRSATITAYCKQPNVDGVLVGAASTKLDSVMEILEKIC